MVLIPLLRLLRLLRCYGGCEPCLIRLLAISGCVTSCSVYRITLQWYDNPESADRLCSYLSNILKIISSVIVSCLFLCSRLVFDNRTSHAASEGSRVDLPSIWHRLVKARLRLSERRAKTCLGYAEREQSRRSQQKQQKQQKQQAKTRQAPCLIYIYYQ